MDTLPLFDACILASAINTMLRDGCYSDLDDICAAFDVDRETVEARLSDAGMEYSPDHKRVVSR